MLVLSQNKHVYPTKEYFSLTKKYFSHLYRIKTLFKKIKKIQTYYIVLKNYFPLTMHIRLGMALAFVYVMIFGVVIVL
jgi:hypothetical protein